MKNYYAHLPFGISELVDKKTIRLVNSKYCPRHLKICKEKTTDKPCCLGLEGKCHDTCACPNNTKT